MKTYAPLHNHSHYSTLDGYATIDEYIKVALDNNMPGIGLADHGTASGLYKFITQAQAAGITPVPGIEFYVAPENPQGAKCKEPVYYGEGGKKAPNYDVSRGAYTHLTVFAYNNTGISNLFKLTSLSWDPQNFYHKPRIDTNMLAEYSEGLIVTTGCPSSEVSKRFLLNQDDKAYEYASRLKSIFGDNLYVEVMDHKMKGEELERVLVPKQIKLAKDLGLKIIATNDSHYAFKTDAQPHEHILAISTKDKMSNPAHHNGGTRFAFSTEEYYIKSYDEMIGLYPKEIAEEALANTLEIVEKCKGIKLEYNPNLRPEIEIPEGYTPATYLQKLIFDGFKAKRGTASKEIQAESMKRIKEEFEVIHSNDFISYFLVVHDYINFAHENGIGCGAGRGSVGGSEIAYVLDISNTDPIRFDLLFERFLSPGRGSTYQIDYVSGESEEISVSSKKQIYTNDEADKVVYVHELNPGDMINHKDGKEVIQRIFVKKPGSAPDVDTDFHTEGRERVVEYCVEKYGKENVANIITFGTFKAKKAFKAMSTIYEVPFAQANKVSNTIPGMQGAEASLKEIMDPNSRKYKEGADFRQAIEGNEVLENAVDVAMELDGRISETGVHPCGLIISNSPLAGTIPTQVRQNDEKLVTQWEYPELESLGLIKMDLLGLDLINTVQQTLENIELANKSAHNPSEIREVPDMRNLILGEMDDPETFKNLREGNTVGIFQLGSPGVRELLKRAQPKEFMDIATITALYRPGPMSMDSHNEWADRVNGSKEIVYIDEDLAGTQVETILKDTAGVLVFQESLMQIATRYAGMSSYESDLLRKAMGKKKVDLMASMHSKFVNGAVEKGSTKKLAEKVWSTMEGFAAYGFNKCLESRAKVVTPTGKVTMKALYEMQESNPDKELTILSMFEDGKLKQHAIEKVVKSGRKPLYTVVTESGKKIRITKEHRLLTTEGYGTIEDGKLSVGNELIVDEEWKQRISDKQRAARKASMTKLNKSPENREQSRKWMTEYQSTLSFEDRSAHQKEISKHSNRHEICLPIGRAKLAELRKDPEWVANSKSYLRNRTRENGFAGKGRMITLSDGREVHSIGEGLAGEYLLERGIEFELHKEIKDAKGETVRYCDFYVNGLYFEMDGLKRGREYFEEKKYGKDIPFVYMTPENFGDVIDEAIMTHHIENGDKIVEIIEPKLSKNGEQYTEMTYDIQMKTTGPANFIADGIVSHNSHSVSYAINIYETIFLKTHYASDFMAALIQQGISDPVKVKSYIQEAVRMKLRLGSVDINNSQVKMSSTGIGKDNKYDIVFGFSGVKKINNKLSEEIVKERNENGKYKSVGDFVTRIAKRAPLTAAPLESLAIAGAFDSFGVSRKLVAEKAKMLVASSSKKVDKGVSLFAMVGSSNDVIESIKIKGADYGYNEMIKLEADKIGMFVSGHPTSKLGHIARSYNATNFAKVLDSETQEEFTVTGTITNIASKTNKAGNRNIAVLLDDGQETHVTYLPKEVVKSITKGEELAKIAEAKAKGQIYKEGSNYEKTKAILEDKSIIPIEPLGLNEPYMFKVKRRGWKENANIVVTWIEKLDTAPDGSLPYELRATSAAQVKEIESVLKEHKTKEGFYVKIHLPGDEAKLSKTRVKLSIDLIMSLENIVGKQNIITSEV